MIFYKIFYNYEQNQGGRIFDFFFQNFLHRILRIYYQNKLSTKIVNYYNEFFIIIMNFWRKLWKSWFFSSALFRWWKIFAKRLEIGPFWISQVTEGSASGTGSPGSRRPGLKFKICGIWDWDRDSNLKNPGPGTGTGTHLKIRDRNRDWLFFSSGAEILSNPGCVPNSFILSFLF